MLDEKCHVKVPRENVNFWLLPAFFEIASSDVLIGCKGAGGRV